MKKQKQTAAYNCKSCSKCSQCYCNFYKRPVDEHFNRCLHHSHYEPFTQTFKVDKNLEIIMKAEEEAKKKHFKGWMREAEYMRKQTLKEIEKEKRSA